VPALLDGAQVVVEAPAIMLHLAEREPDGGLLPEPGSAARSRTYAWVSFLATMVQQAFMRRSYPERYSGAGEPAAVRAAADRLLHEQFDCIDAQLPADGWIEGERCSIADLYLFMLTCWGANLTPTARERPRVRAHAARCLELAGVQRMLDEQGLLVPTL
jgi:glutathione S-transferase